MSVNPTVVLWRGNLNYSFLMNWLRIMKEFFKRENKDWREVERFARWNHGYKAIQEFNIPVGTATI